MRRASMESGPGSDLYYGGVCSELQGASFLWHAIFSRAVGML